MGGGRLNYLPKRFLFPKNIGKRKESGGKRKEKESIYLRQRKIDKQCCEFMDSFECYGDAVERYSRTQAYL
jgi:hypothetical protein